MKPHSDKMENLEFKSLKNARDFSSLTTENGKHIRPGAVIRSGSLYNLKKSDLKLLKEKYDLKAVIDLRSMHEKENKPDTLPEGARYYENPYYNEATLAITSGMGSDVLTALKTSKNKQELYNYVPDLKSVYPLMASSEYTVSQMAQCLRIIFNNREGSVIFHCTAGKDRTGVTAAVLLRILGVPEKDIIDDYLYTNVRYKSISSFYGRLALIFLRDKPLAEKVKKVFLVDREYYEAFFNEIDNVYGCFDNFVKDGLKLTDEEIEGFKDYILI